MSNDPLLQPYRLKHLTLRNRIMTTAHEPAYPEEGMPKARYRAYHVERAKGGIALTMTAGSAAVSRDSPPVFNNLLVYKDEVVPWMKDLADAVHEQGAAIMIQLTHLGRRTRWDKNFWLPVVSPSLHKEAAHRAFPKRLETWDIERIVKDYADAAERMQAAGLDGIELQAYGHLMDQFWSPLTNTLEEPYGGSFDNRLRFSFDVLKAIRARVGSEYLVGVRCVADEVIEGGLTKADGIEISRRLKDSGMIDFLNIVRGHIDTDAGLTDLIPIQGMASAPHLDFTGEIRAATRFPIFHAAKIEDVATARHAIASGKVDMIGMTRAHMTDPHIVRKIIAGQEDDIRPCVGANYCLDRIYQGGAAYCIHNPATGRELAQAHEILPAAVKRKLVIIGAGPAGLEAARVGALRGHEVVVLEAAAQPGGQLRLTARSPRRQAMLGIIDWRMQQCLKAGVEFRFETLAEESDVLALAPDVVLIATGGSPHTDVLEEGKSGAKLEIMTPDRAFAPEVMAMNLVPYMRSLQKLDVTFTVTYRLLSVRREGGRLHAIVGSDYGGVRRERLVDQVVINHGTVPNEDLYFALKPLSRNEGRIDHERLLAGVAQASFANPKASFEIYRLGDAVSARNTHAAIYDALRLVRTL
jgi:2,4-dienoyl-CoA reductase-like NADH-dependent reductase (Old Yellow Enzyme family)/thioredoxin reductase